MCIAFHPKLPSVIAGGTFNGTCGMHFQFCSLLSSKNSDYLTLCNMCTVSMSLNRSFWGCFLPLFLNVSSSKVTLNKKNCLTLTFSLILNSFSCEEFCITTHFETDKRQLYAIIFVLFIFTVYRAHSMQDLL